MISIPQNIIDLKPYVPGKPISEVQREFGIERIVKLASNENPLGTSPLALQAMMNSMTELSRYPNVGTIDLRKKISDVFKINIENIIAGSGSEGIMSVIMRSFLEPGDNVISSIGTFIGFYVLANAVGTEMNLTQLNNYHYDINAIAERINKRTKIIYIANPNNPTGTIVRRKEFEEFMKVVPETCLVIMDEAYYEYANENPDYPDSLNYRYDNVITLRTFSKAYGLAGIRIGYGFGHEFLIGNLLKAKLPFEPSITAQQAGIAALDDKQFLQYHIEMNRAGKAYLYQVFDDLGLHYINSDTNFIMLAFDSEDTVTRINNGLLRNGVIVRPLTAFKLPNCIRVTIGLPEENVIFADSLKKVL
jgi:histidinol-phosphate aminotransferase